MLCETDKLVLPAKIYSLSIKFILLLNSIFIVIIIGLQKEISTVRDERIKITNEVLAGMKVIKLQAWYVFFPYNVLYVFYCIVFLKFNDNFKYYDRLIHNYVVFSLFVLLLIYKLLQPITFSFLFFHLILALIN